MKKFFCINLLLVVLITSCSKILDKEDSTYHMQVFEYNTNTPIPDVRIEMYYCARSVWGAGCVSIGLLATGYTDNNGRYEFKANNFKNANEGIKLTKDKYWEGSGGEGIQYLVPEACWICDLYERMSIPKQVFSDLRFTGNPLMAANFISELRLIQSLRSGDLEPR